MNVTAAAPIPDLLNTLYAAATALVKAMTDPAVIEEASLKDRANALNAISRFVAMLHKFIGQPQPAHDSGETAAAFANASAAGVRLPAPQTVDAEPALNRHERRRRDALLRQSQSAQPDKAY